MSHNPHRRTEVKIDLPVTLPIIGSGSFPNGVEADDAQLLVLAALILPAYTTALPVLADLTAAELVQGLQTLHSMGSLDAAIEGLL